jgi:hypothetical protein
MEAMRKLTLEAKRGRPPTVTLLPEHAAAIRRAVKAAARYFGMRIGDFGNWVETAMRTKTKLSLDVATELFRAVQPPSVVSVAKKQPQGPSLADTLLAVHLFIEDPIANPLPDSPTAEYLKAVFEAAAILNLYRAPLPGSAMFVLPGLSQSLAAQLVDSFAEELERGAMSLETRTKLVRFVEHHFKIAERPLYTEQGRQLLPQLMTLGVANRRELTRIITEQFPDAMSPDIESSVATLEVAEQRRSDATAGKRPKKAPRGKRKVTLRRNIDDIF